jgi:Mg2+/Co2+ transporter CorC
VIKPAVSFLQKRPCRPIWCILYPSETTAHANYARAPSSVKTDAKPHRSLFERLTALISPEPENRAELLEVLHDAHERNLIDADALSMIEGVFQVSDLSARDIMVPRSQMDVIDISKPIEEWMPPCCNRALALSRH